MDTYPDNNDLAGVWLGSVPHSCCQELFYRISFILIRHGTIPTVIVGLRMDGPGIRIFMVIFKLVSNCLSSDHISPLQVCWLTQALPRAERKSILVWTTMQAVDAVINVHVGSLLGTDGTVV